MTSKGVKSELVFKSLLEEENLFIGGSGDNLSSSNHKEKEWRFPHGKGYEYLSENIYYRYVKMDKKIAQDTLLNMPPDFVQMVFCLNGSCRYVVKSDPKLIFELEGQHHNMVYFGNQEVELKVSPLEEFEGVVIYIRHLHFQKYFIPQVPKLKEFHNQISVCKGGLCLLSNTNLPLNYKLALALHQLIEEDEPKETRYHFVEAKVVELLMLQWAILVKKEKKLDTTPLKEEEIEKMYTVKKHLIHRMNDGLTLKSLAHEVGTNEYHLKKHFKQVFGQTVFGFLHSYKMEMAKTMLLDPMIRISELSERLGYKHATHFSAAFKKHFGHLPRERRYQEMKGSGRSKKPSASQKNIL